MTIAITLDGAFGFGFTPQTAMGGDVVAGCTVVRFPYNNWQLFPSGPTYENAIDDLNSMILNTLASHPTEDVKIVGYSLGSVMACGWLGKYGNSSTASHSRLSFVLMANSVRKDGGVLVNSMPTNRLCPDNTPYQVLDLAVEYDGWADWPTKIPPPNLQSIWTADLGQLFETLRQLGTQAGENALLGMSTIHGTGYADRRLADEHYDATVGNITYRLYSTAIPPLVQASYPFALEGYLSQRASERRPMIEVKYQRLVTVPGIAPLGGIRTRQDSEKFWQSILNRRKRLERDRLRPPRIRLFDGDGVLRGEVAGWRKVNYKFIENDTGTAGLRLSLDHYLAKWIMNFRGRKKRNVHVVIDKQGTRWNGFMDSFTFKKEKGGDKYLEVTFKHDFEQAKHILCWANPFLRPEVQFPKVWTIFGPAKWCLLMTLFVNIFRLESSLWTLPDNPLDINEWIPFSFNPGVWRNLVKPFPLLGDNSPITVVFSRFKSWFDVAQKQLKDSQLTVVCKRYIKGEDEHPFSDLKGELDVDFVEDLFKLIPIRNFCLIWDIVDNSEWGTETSFGGSFLTGLTRAAVQIADDGTTEGVDVFTGKPTYPGEYYQPGWMGTNPKVPHVVFLDGTYNGIQESEFTYYEATDTSFVGGGESMPGINEAISAGVNMAGDFLTSIINTLLAPGGAFGSAIDLPPLGGIMDAVAKILYENTFLAWMEVPTLRAAGETLPLPGLESTETGLGDFHLFEGLAEGATRAFTLSMLMAIRAKIWATRARTAHKIKVSDAAPYYVGENGKGHFFLGSRVGTTFRDYPIPDTIFVERVTEIEYTYDEDGPKGWDLTIGYVEQQDPAFKALEAIRDINAGLGQWGIL